jgi:hypothetical protein
MLRRYIVERDILKIGDEDRGLLQQIAARSNFAIRDLSPDIQWIESFVTDNRTVCLYLATDVGILRSHAALAGLPVTRISPVNARIDPTTAS